MEHEVCSYAEAVGRRSLHLRLPRRASETLLLQHRLGPQVLVVRVTQMLTDTMRWWLPLYIAADIGQLIPRASSP